MHRLGREGRGDSRCDAAVPPGNHLAVLVKTGFDPFRRDGMEEVVVKVVFPRPLHLHRRTDRLRQQRRLQHEVAFRFAPETTAEQRDIDGHVILGDTESLGDVFAGPARTLHGGPDLGLAVLDFSDRDRRFHAHMREVRQVVFPDNHLVGGPESSVDIALLAHDETRLARGFLEFGPIG